MPEVVHKILFVHEGGHAAIDIALSAVLATLISSWESPLLERKRFSHGRKRRQGEVARARAHVT